MKRQLTCRKSTQLHSCPQVSRSVTVCSCAQMRRTVNTRCQIVSAAGHAVLSCMEQASRPANICYWSAITLSFPECKQSNGESTGLETDPFLGSLALYLQTHKFQNAVAGDFLTAFDDFTGSWPAHLRHAAHVQQAERPSSSLGPILQASGTCQPYMTVCDTFTISRSANPARLVQSCSISSQCTR